MAGPSNGERPGSGEASTPTLIGPPGSPGASAPGAPVAAAAPAGRTAYATTEFHQTPGPIPTPRLRPEAARAATEYGPPDAAPVASAGPPRRELTPGQVLAERYRVVRKLGSGGMGDVWEVEHVVIGRTFALKVLSPDETGPHRREQAERLMREARAVGQLHHPHIVDISDFGHTPGGDPFFVMERLYGRTMKQLVAETGALNWRRACLLLLQVADALAHAHARGVIHRDLKPDNVFVSADAQGADRCKVIDFGIAKLNLLDSQAQAFTRTGMVYGSPAFMAPEQARGEKLDGRADLYALGCSAFQVLTGKHPFHGDTPTEVLYKHLFEPPPPLRRMTPNTNIPEALERVIGRTLAKDPKHRFADMAEFRDAIAKVLASPDTAEIPTLADAPLAEGPAPTLESMIVPAKARPLWPWVVGSALLTSFAVIALQIRERDAVPPPAVATPPTPAPVVELPPAPPVPAAIEVPAMPAAATPPPDPAAQPTLPTEPVEAPAVRPPPSGSSTPAASEPRAARRREIEAPLASEAVPAEPAAASEPAQVATPEPEATPAQPASAEDRRKPRKRGDLINPFDAEAP